MEANAVDRHRTALKRTELSRPVRRALADGIITSTSSVLDYGCGHGSDVEQLSTRGIECRGWDPFFRPHSDPLPADVVNLGYVINVIEDPCERIDTLKRSWSLTTKVLIVSAQVGISIRGRSTPFSDGILTGIGTFQKLYEQGELRNYIELELQQDAVPAEPGIFYVFRRETDRQQYVANRFRSRAAAPRKHRSELIYEQNRDLLDSLMEVTAGLGRPPEDGEWARRDETICRFGSIKKAFALIRRLTGNESWDDIARRRREDLLVFLALASFRSRPSATRLPQTIRNDIRYFCGTYSKACSAADELLFRVGDSNQIDEACRQSKVGKLLPKALYCHRSAVGTLAPLLRMYEGCARMYLGDVEGTTLIKLHRFSGKISYLVYPRFDTDPHPQLARSIKLSLRTREIDCRDYSSSSNPPVLHRKETFLLQSDPLFGKFEKLTRQEEAAGLLEDAATIGTLKGWEARLGSLGYKLRGHRLVRAR